MSNFELRLEEALEWYRKIPPATTIGNLYQVVQAAHAYAKLLPLLQELVDARALATKGEWLYRSEPFDDWGKVRSAENRYSICNAFNAHYLTPDEEAVYRKTNTDPYAPNALFIAIAANVSSQIADLLSHKIDGDTA